MTEGTYIAIIGTLIVFILTGLMAMVNSLKNDFKKFVKDVVTYKQCEREHQNIEKSFSRCTDWIARTERKVDLHILNNHIEPERCG